VTCPPHRWDENGAVDGLVLAHCLYCPAKQWHITDIRDVGDGPNTLQDKIKLANDLNKRDGLELIVTRQNRLFDTSLKNNHLYFNKEVQPMVGVAHVNSEAEAEKLGIKLPAEKSKGQILYEQHALEAGLKSPWKALSQKIRDGWERKSNPDFLLPPITRQRRNFEKDKDAIIVDYRRLTLKNFYKKWKLNSYKWKELKIKWRIVPKGTETVSKEEDPVPPIIPDEKPDDILMDVIKVIVTGKSEEEIVKVGWAARIKLAKLSQHLRVKLALVQSLVDYCNLDNDDEFIQQWFEAKSRELEEHRGK
jgi:hypothetical protein